MVRNILPALKCWPCDGGRFVTLPMVNTIDPDTHIRNVGMYRMQIFDSAHCGMHWHRHKTGARHYEAYKARGERMPVSIAIGGDPAYTYAATAPMPDNMDEYLLAGFLRQKPVTLVKSITNDIYVPSDCDFVIEGYVDTTEPLRVEGDFGDHTGFYSLKDLYPQLHITAITHRRDAVYAATIVGIPPQEDAYISQATERIFLEPIRLVMQPEVEDLYMPVSGTSHNIAIMSLKTRYMGQATKVAQGMWGAGQMMFNKYLVLLPQGVNIRDRRHLAWFARNFTVQNLYVSDGIYDVLDHATATNGYGGKVAFDCTSIPTATENDLRSIKSTEIGDITLPDGISYRTDLLGEWGVLLLFASADAKVDFGVICDQIGTIDECRTVALFDDKAANLNGEELLWLATANSDPRRDLHIVGEHLCVDARPKLAKDGETFPLRWPNVVCSSEETIALVDNRWAEYAIGERIESPSQRYRKLLYSDTAEI
ncbi:MAG: UbiD family decarboxylase [Alistipes sp.]|nr:UbiD family decarboxylase [Alistipes sp.]